MFHSRVRYVIFGSKILLLMKFLTYRIEKMYVKSVLPMFKVNGSNY